MPGIRIDIRTGEINSFASDPPIRTAQQAYDEAIIRLQLGFENELSFIRKRYSQSERDGWPMQIESAKANKSAQPSPLIDALATARGGITSSVASDMVLQKFNEYQTFYATATGKMGDLRDQADAALLADDIATLDAITW